MKKIMTIILCGMMLLGLVTGCGNKTLSEEDVLNDINKVVNNQLTTKTIKDFKEKLDTYSDYKLIDKSDKEFTTKPTEPNYVIQKFYESDLLNNSTNTDIDRYFLIYNEKNNTYYSTKCEWDKENKTPIFVEAKELK